MEDKLIDFEELWDSFRRRWWIIIVVTVITTALGVYKVFGLQPTYFASAKIFIGRGGDMIQIYSDKEIEYYSKFLSIFKEISTLDGFFDKTLQKNNITKSSMEVAGGLNFSGGGSTPIYTVSYSSWTEEDIAQTVDAVCEELMIKIKEIMPETEPSILSKATVGTIYPDKRKLPIMAFAVGIVLSIGIILVLDYLDDKIRNKKQLEKLLPIPVIGDIPTHEKAFVKEEKHVRSKSRTKVSIGRSI